MMEYGWKGVQFWLTLLTLSSLSESVRFTNEPQERVTVRLGQSVWLHWKYAEEGKETLIQNEVYFKNSTLNKFVKIASGTRLTKEPGFSKVKTYPGINVTIAITNADYSYTGIYYFRVTVNNPLSVLVSRNVSLIVEGKPDFCGGLPSDSIRKKEGETATVNVALCAVPEPKLTHKWNDGQNKDVQSLSAGGPFFRYTASFSLPSLNRNRCGRNVTYFAKNSIGESAKHQIKVEVLFKPAKPTGVNAYYVNNGKGVKVTWNKQESGLCEIDYKVEFLNSTNQVVGTKPGKNIVTATLDDFMSNNVTAVNVTASTSEGTATEFYQVSSGPPPTDPPPPGNGDGDSDSSVWIIVGCVVGGILLITIIIVAVIYGKRTGCGKIGGPQDDRRDQADPYVSAQRPNKQSEYAQVGYKADQQIYADARQGVVYGELGAGGGRTGPRAAKPVESNYADIKLTAEGYPASGPTASPYGNTMISDEAIV